VNWLYIALALREAGREINEKNMRKVLAAMEVQVNEAELRFFTSAMAILSMPKPDNKADESYSPVEEAQMAQRQWDFEESAAAGRLEDAGREQFSSPVKTPIEEKIESIAPAESPVIQYAGQTGSNDALYIYGIADKGVSARLGPIGLEGSEVYTIPYNSICAVVHDCCAQPYQSDDNEVVKAWVLAHQKVLDAAVERFDAAILPMGFDTIIRGKEEMERKQVVKDWLDQNCEDLIKKLTRIKGKQEFGVQVLWDPKIVAGQITETDDEIRELGEETKEKPRGTAYMNKQKLDKLLKQKMEKMADKRFKEFYARIKGCVDDIVVEKTKKTENGRQMLMNLSCLVEKGRVQGLGEELEGIENMEGFFVRFTGPWPPYSFVTPAKI